MKTNQKTMRLIAVLLVLVMMICASACSGSDVDERQSRETGKATPTEKQKDPAPTEGEKDPTPTEGVPEATPTPEPVKLTIWVDSAERDFDWQVFDKAVNEMRELHPEILVQLEGMDHYTYETKLSAAVDFGALPDISC